MQMQQNGDFIQEEQLSTQRCLQICAQLSDRIDQSRLTHQSSSGSPGFANPDTLPERLTNMGLQECKDCLALTASKLEKHMQDLMDRLITKSKTAIFRSIQYVTMNTD